uniref:Hydroxyphenylpyruvate reductase (HPPR) n=1 Tax=Solanum tuberosum TaxID=4113 RepID=M1ACA1_SOLTU
MAFAIPTKCGSSNLAEAYAAMVGAAWCVGHGYTKFVLELDSLIVVNMLKERSTENYKLRAIIDDIIQILSQAEVEV